MLVSAVRPDDGQPGGSGHQKDVDDVLELDVVIVRLLTRTPAYMDAHRFRRDVSRGTVECFEIKRSLSPEVLHGQVGKPEMSQGKIRAVDLKDDPCRRYGFVFSFHRVGDRFEIPRSRREIHVWKEVRDRTWGRGSHEQFGG